MYSLVQSPRNQLIPCRKPPECNIIYKMAWFNFGRTSSSRHRPGYARSSSSSYSRSSSYYKRRPRDGYINGLIDKFRHLIRELWYYARRNKFKVFFLVVMPLISGGALAAFARQFGVRLPSFLNGKHGGHDSGRMSSGGGYYGSKGYGDDMGSEMGGLGSLLGGGGASSLLSVAKMFL
ncbi:hypothetical protein BT63DRAFT_461634 [Microthyrium microscopicum]|uniref:Uncharacterized protein n=1 Tax=Microthyrium microscopicum TaxID=703497 RepID=A0A6A6TUJ7_9PEZI|nr:hypothetical protein BT63DRAFT_461634 [Microthyrium microscopicum]